MNRIKWSVFDQNSSERDSIFDFAEGRLSLKSLQCYIWTEEGKKEFKKLKACKTERARYLAKKWIYRYENGS